MSDLTWDNIPNEALAELAEKLSASQIAQQLGTSRNAVIGRCRRRAIKLGNATDVQIKVRMATDRAKLRQRRAEKSEADPIKAQRHTVVAVAERKARLAKPMAVRSDDYTPRGLTIFELMADSCRFPLWGDRASFSAKVYCGLPSEPNDSYCAHCAKLAYNPRATKYVDKKLGIPPVRRAA